MTTIPTQNPVPSESPRDLKFNAGKIDEFVTSSANTYIDRFGDQHYTSEGLKNLTLQHIYDLGWNPVGSFQGGATLTAAGDIIHDTSTGLWYRWDNLASLPKIIPVGSTPASTGGVGAGAWQPVDVTDVLRRDLTSASDGKGDALVMVKAPFSNSVPRTQHDKNLETISVKDFGAIGDGSADDTTAFRNALNALYGKTACLFIPAGNYRISSRIDFDLGANTHIEIRGAGNNLVEIRAVGASQSVFKITGPSGNIWLNSVTPNGSIDFKDLSFACYGGFNSTGICLEIQTGCVLGGPSKNSTFENVTFRCDNGYWGVQVLFHNTAQIHFTNCMFYSGNNVRAGIGVKIDCDAGSDGSGLYFTQCDFYFLHHGVYHGDHFEGVSFNTCGFGNCDYGFTSICTAESGALITNCEFDCYVEGIHLEGMYDFAIHGNAFLAMGDNTTGIVVVGGNGFSITGNKISGTSHLNGTGILLQNTNASLNKTGYVGENSINSYNIAMSVNGCNNITFGDFSWYDCTLDTLLSGTNTNLQDAGYTLSKSVVATLASSVTEWTLSVDITPRKLTRKPVYAALVSNSLSGMIIRYDYATSTNTSAVFKITLASGGNIPANTYGFSLFINTPMFQ